jgi:hypothetical protein
MFLIVEQPVKWSGGQSMSHTTVHRRLQELAASHDPFGVMKDRAFRFLVVDGTKVRLQGPLGKDLGRVEMRWALASLGSLSRFEPVGFWIDTEWAEIRKDLEGRLDYHKLEVLFCDGGPCLCSFIEKPGHHFLRPVVSTAHPPLQRKSEKGKIVAIVPA